MGKATDIVGLVAHHNRCVNLHADRCGADYALGVRAGFGDNRRV